MSKSNLTLPARSPPTQENLLEKLRDKEKLAKLAREMSHPSSGAIPSQAEIIESIRVGQLPSAFRPGGAPGLEGGVPTDPYLGLSPLDIIPTGMGTKLAALGASGLAALGATKIGSVASQGAKFPALASALSGQRGATAWHGADNVAKKNTKTNTKTNSELAHEIAQRNAARPVEKGGLGLPLRNTAMDRAKAMGFSDKPMYHGTSADIDQFNLYHGGDVSRSPVGKLGVSLADNPALADEYAMLAAAKRGDQAQNAGANVLPLLHRKDRGASMPLDDDVLNSEVFGAIVDAQKQGVDAIKMTNYTTPSGKKIGPAYLIQNPNQIRSRFAAFDPFNRNSANILAGTALGGVGLLSLTGNRDGFYD